MNARVLKTAGLVWGFLPVMLSGQRGPVFELGTPRDDISHRFGTATVFYAPEPDRHFVGDIEYQAAVGIWSLQDVYPRKTATNEFEFRLKFDFDKRESKLHPVELSNA